MCSDFCMYPNPVCFLEIREHFNNIRLVDKIEQINSNL